MTSSNAPEMQIVQSLLDALQALPGAHAELRFIEGPSTPSGYRPDAEISLEMGGRQYALRVEAKRELFPRDAREVLWRMDRSTSTNDGSAILRMVAADSLSPGAKDLLKAEGVGYFDRGGSRTRPPLAPMSTSTSRRQSSHYQGNRLAVDRAPCPGHPRLAASSSRLAHRERVGGARASIAGNGVTGDDRARAAGVHRRERPGSAQGTTTTEPGRLLDQWAEYVKALKLPVFHRYFLPSLRAEQLLEAVTRVFAANEVAYAVSFEAAAQAYAPFLSSLSQVKCRAMSGSALEAGLAALNARVVEEGANFSVLETESAGDLLFPRKKQHHGTWLASPIQVYLDLLRSEGRARELAQRSASRADFALMPKPQHIGGYTAQHTTDCERVRIAEGARPLGNPSSLWWAYAPISGSSNASSRSGMPELWMLTWSSTCRSWLTRAPTKRSSEICSASASSEAATMTVTSRVSWCWQTKTERGASMILEFLADDPAMRGGRVQELPTKETYRRSTSLIHPWCLTCLMKSRSG